MIRVITLANGRRVTIGQYVKAIKLAKANPDATFKHGLTGWWPVTGREIVAQFWQMVQDLINRHLPPIPESPDPSTLLLKLSANPRPPVPMVWSAVQAGGIVADLLLR